VPSTEKGKTQPSNHSLISAKREYGIGQKALTPFTSFS
jgi:hypothetical protein